MAALAGKAVFLSASFPSGERGARFEPVDPAAIADAVSSLIRATFVAGGRVVFGGHPTITPLVLLGAAEYSQKGSVDIFQSQWFAVDTPTETLRLEHEGYGTIHWTKRRGSREESLTLMREEMLGRSRPVAAAFIGGMEGLFEEWDLVGALLPECVRVPFAGPGGAARQLAETRELPDKVRELATSRRYPVLARQLLELV
jgi:hypothetical protein